jgi:hypothetical protein
MQFILGKMCYGQGQSKKNKIKKGQIKRIILKG